MIPVENKQYKRVEEAIRYLTENYMRQPSLYEVADAVHLSPFHFQKIFTDWAGISPKKFLQYLTVETLKKELQQTRNLSEAAERVGLSTQSRVYDLFVQIEAVTPNEYKTGGAGMFIEYGIHPTPFGDCLLALTDRGICALRFIDENETLLLTELQQEWRAAHISRNQNRTKEVVGEIFKTSSGNKIKLLLKGTNFQLKVWNALVKIPFGNVVSYQTIGEEIENPQAVRAVGSAVGANPVAYIIPCHRVIRRDAIIGEYRWGTIRKKALLGWEKAQGRGA